MGETTMVLLTGLIGTVFVTALFGAALAGAWLLGRDQGRRRAETDARTRGAAGAGGLADAATMARALEVLTVEVERIAEAQRFTVALLTNGRAPERAVGAGAAPRPPERDATPH